MLARFRAHLDASGLIAPDARVLVGYSGGPDSTCLLSLLHEVGIDLVAAHLNHGQREEADIEMRLCEAFCQELGVPFLSGNADVPRMSVELGIGLEEAGRKARYAFFEQAAFQLQCGLIATAHTRSDLVETVLLNLSRGSGLSGLAGIPAKRDNIVRPLLPFSREETRAYCEEHAFWTHEDPANQDISFSRARIRHRVLSELRAINPKSEEAISRLAELAGEEDRFLNGMAAAALEQSEIKLNGTLAFLTSDVEVCFDRNLLGALPATLFRRAIRLAAGSLGGPLNFDQIAGIARGIVDGGRGSITAEGGAVAVEWDGDTITVRQLAPTVPFHYPLTMPGLTLSEEFGWQISAVEGPATGQAPVRVSLQAGLDKARLRGGLFFRTAEPGDKLQPIGFSGHRKLSDLMREAHLSLAARSRLPIVCDMVGPLWAPGVCLDERAKPTADTKLEIRLAFAPIEH